MLGIIFTAIGTLFQEISSSIGKIEMGKEEESSYTFAVLNLIWGALFFLILVIINPARFVFSFESLPTFGLRVVFEVFQVLSTVFGIKLADRTSAGFLRVGTVPLLLGVDVFLGYAIGFYQWIGIGVILLSFLFIFTSHTIKRKGLWILILGTINAVITITLFKYNISNFNSVEAEQILIHVILILIFFSAAHFLAKENPFRFLRRRIFFAQSFVDGIAGVLESFAYLFAPASVITAAKRSFAILWATISGERYFHERHVLMKAAVMAFLVIGIIFLTIQSG